MLIELNVSNFAIIENINLQFQKGLNILSGETGAGKSILLKSLGLLMGGKAQPDMIRTGQNSASIEGCFDLSERPDIVERLKNLDISTDDGLLTVRRVIGNAGRSRIYLNNIICTLTNLREIISPLVEVAGKSAPLIEMTGQHENKSLTSKSYHIDMLDHYIGAQKEKQALHDNYQQLKQLQDKISELSEKSQQREQQLDFLKYQVNEINQLNLVAGDEVEIKNTVDRLKHASRIAHFIDRNVDLIYTSDHSLLSQLASIRSEASELSQYSPELKEKMGVLNETNTLLNDFVHELRNLRDHTELSPEVLELESERLSQLRRLQKKFGETALEILSARDQMQSEIEELNNMDDRLEELAISENQLTQKINAIADDLHQRRLNGGTLLSESVNEELSDLNMKGVSFEAKVEKTGKLNANGFSDVEFMTRTSKKDPLKPLNKAASGGELSRLLLSLKRVIGKGEYPRTYLFDEVDTGVSGQTAEKVGRKLRATAKGQQVICVTHLPQVSAFGDIHFCIDKDAKTQQMSVSLLSKKQRINEIARLISGEKITPTSVAHAEQLIADSL